ncbi:hypothetical protein V8F20_000421 [Naviculisporaceae sp. PSN 640]
MPRPPKNKAAEAPKVVEPAPPQQQRVIDVENFIRVRDSVFQRFMTIQDLIKSFSADYLRQMNLLLGQGDISNNGLDFDQLTTTFGNIAPIQFAPPPPPVEEKKERKKRTHDPNAPKRPLTPYFLYMQTARPIIANDLGEDAPKGAVQEEGQRRWSVMGAAEKAGWNNAYQYNLRLYNARVHSYKHGNANAKNMTDEEAIKYADDFNIEMPAPGNVEDTAGNDQDAIAQQLAQQNAPVEESEEEVPATKTPKSKGKDTRKPRKTATPAAPEPEPPKAVQTPASPQVNKRKRTSKAADLIEEPKKSGRKKTKA